MSDKKNDIIMDVKRLMKEHGKITRKIYKEFGSFKDSEVYKVFGSYTQLKEEMGVKNTGKKTLISKDNFIKEVKNIYEKFGTFNSKLFEENSKFGEYYVVKFFGNYKKMCIQLNIEYTSSLKLNKEDISEDVMRVYKKFGYMKRELYEKEGKHSWCAIRSHFGSFNNLLRHLNLPINMYKKDYNKKEILDEMYGLYKRYGYLTSELQRKESSFSQGIIDKEFGSFGSMIDEMGINKKYTRVDDGTLLSELSALYQEYGVLNRAIINNSCSISYEGCVSRFGSVEGLISFIGGDIEAHKKINTSYGHTYCKNVISSFLKENPKEEYSWDWLISPHSNRKMRVDMYFKESNLAVEYDGEQHYKFIKWMHKDFKNFLKSKERDAKKNKLLEDNGIKLIRIKKEELKEDIILKKVKSAI